MKKRAKRFWTVTAICGGTALLFMVLAWVSDHYESDQLQELEYYTQDFRVTKGIKTPVDPRLVLIGIDQTVYPTFFSEDELREDSNLQLMNQTYPWSRAVWADLITKLGEAGAKVIVLDLLFGGQSEYTNGDLALRQALDKYKDQVVIGCNIHDLNSDRGDTRTLDTPNASVLNSASPASSAFDERVGFVNIWADRDGVFRFARYRLEGSEAGDLVATGSVLESLDARALRKFGHPEAIPPGSDSMRFRYTAWAGAGYPAIPLGNVMSPKLWKQNFKNGEFFRGKMVFVGPTADIFQDAHKTPLPDRDIKQKGVTYSSSSLMTGPEIHLNVIGAALHGTFLRDTGRYTNMLIILIAAIVATTLSFLIHQPLARLGTIMIIVVAYWYCGQWLFDHKNLVVPEASPLLVLTISGVFVLTYDYFVERFERSRVRGTLERYVSKNIVKELLDNPATYFHTLEGVRKPVTILFSDIRGFTSMAEASEEKQLVQQLNEYLTEMVEVVFKYEGTLDKFIGDAVMAVWGNAVPRPLEEDAQNAVFTALAMKRSLAKLNLVWKSRGIKELAIGIGINHGQAIVGNFGSPQKMDPTVIGDAVNTASRLEGLTKKFHQELLIGETMAPLVRDRFILRTVGLLQPKGKTVPAEVYAVISERTSDADAKLEAWLAEYEAGVKLYRKREFAAAREKFERCLAGQADYLCELYIKECQALIQNPPDADWNGVFVMTEK